MLIDEVFPNEQVRCLICLLSNSSRTHILSTRTSWCW